MSKKKFEDLSDAEKIEYLSAELAKANEANATKDELIKTQAGQITTLTQEVADAQVLIENATKANEANAILISTQASQITTLTQEVKDAEAIATEAVANANAAASAVPGEITVEVKKKTYIVNFGVDGLTKEEVANDAELLTRLVGIGSGALSLKED